MAASSLVTTVVLFFTMFPFALAFLSVSLALFLVAIKNPREGSGFNMGLSGIILGTLLISTFFRLVDLDNTFMQLMVVLAAIYFMGSLTVYSSLEK